ncbi:MAG: hypothetical protein AAFR16_06695 [Pseudomonadota bacterium]
MVRNLRLAAVLAALVMLATAGPRAAAQTIDQATLCADPDAACSALVAPACLSRTGAGSVAVGAAPQGCDAQIDSYRTCLQDVAEQCGGSGRADHGFDDSFQEPQIAPMMVMQCFNALFAQSMCQGQDNWARVMISDFTNSPDLFGTIELDAYAVEQGRATRIAAMTDAVDKASVGRAEIGAALDRTPEVIGFCLRYSRDGAREGRVHLFRLSSMVTEAMGRQFGQRVLEMKPVSGQEPFEVGSESCEAAVARVAAARGL